MIKLLSFHLALGVLFGLLIVSTFFLGAISLRNKKEAAATTFWLNHTHEVLQSVNKISSLSNKAQLESLLLFSGEGPVPAVTYTKIRDSLISTLEHLYAEANENPKQTLRIDSLRTLLTAMVQFTDSAALAGINHTYTELSLAKRMYRHKLFAEEITRAVSGITAEEEKELYERGQANEGNIKALEWAFYCLLAFLLMLLAVTFLAIRHHIGQRTKMEQELKKANDIYIKLFYESPIGLVISRSTDGLILDCNQAFASLVNYRRDDLLNQTAQQLGIVTDDAHRDSVVKEAQSCGAPQNVETQLNPKEKEPVWVSVSTQLVMVQDEPCLLCAMVDLTSHRKGEEKMAKALDAEKSLNKMMSGFVTLASHEFRTPLSTILSSSFLIENYANGETREKISKHILRIKGSVKILTSILDEFLLLSRIEEGSLQTQPELVDIEALLEEACVNLKAFSKPGQNITYTHTGEHQVYTDPLLLASIVNNLVSNAIKFSPDDTNILVTSEVNSRVHITVKDNGIGIPPQEHHHLFDRFYRASNAGAVQGTGIGLHLLKQYVELLGGSIELKSELGKGSEFKITI